MTIVSPAGTPSSLGFAQRVLSLASSGQWLFVGTADGTIHVIDTSGAPREVASSREHTAEANSLEVGPDGATLASGSDDRSIVIWTVGPDGRLADRLQLVGHTDRINTLSISPDGDWLASSGEDHHVILWNLDTGERIGDPIPVRREPAVAFTRQGDRQLFVSDDRSGLVRWEMRPEAWARIACDLIDGRTFSQAERDQYLGGATPPSRCDEQSDGDPPKVRDPRFITVRRGGTLQDDDHQRLAMWAADCAEHVLHHFEQARPRTTVHVGRSTLGVHGRGVRSRGAEARTAAGHANAAARDLRGAARHAAYAAGQAAAVGHVAAHELGAAAYAVRAVRAAAPEDEREAAGRLECQWQRAQLPDEIRELVLDDQRLRNELCWFAFDC